MGEDADSLQMVGQLRPLPNAGQECLLPKELMHLMEMTPFTSFEMATQMLSDILSLL